MADERPLPEVSRFSEKTWLVRRYGYISEVEDYDGSIKYRVVVADLGRTPFINRLFRRRAAAEDFYDSLIRETALPQSIEKYKE